MWMSSTSQMEVPLQSQLTISQLIDVPIAVQLNPTSFNLPRNWVVEQRYRNSPKYANISDKFFYDPDTGKKFRSLKSARKHLEEKDKNKNLQNLEASQDS
ncbi:hypothetical protein VitviT2T_020105 [Vitis vinifera]|uniref:MBD domain-containing protein n=1 Tax=Vitis vinifera TaxID=29760 RepID=A0ABY9D3B5_VITVI|nr:hypothetical protein VitviT2T_020105 [Vitis vinifera]